MNFSLPREVKLRNMEEEKQSYRIKLGYTPTLVKIIRLCALSKTTSQTLNVLVRNRSSLLYYSVQHRSQAETISKDAQRQDF